MAVTQISKIQVRRGLQADIGNLAAGEFAWAIDTQRLFIGNGTTDEGAPIGGITEISTRNGGTGGSSDGIITDYVYKGLLGGYEVVTGPDTTTPVVRSLQDKIDDIVNARDFGVAGTGNVDDTNAIQRAIFELYDRFEPSIDIKTRRRLRLSAGTYLIEGELKIPPYCVIEGEGTESVHLLLKAPIKFVTSTGIDAGVIVAPADYPYGIQINNLTIRSDMSIQLLDMDGSKNVEFNSVSFSGPKVDPDNNFAESRGVDIASTSVISSRVIFNKCNFKKFDKAVYITSKVGTYGVDFNQCLFEQCGEGIVTETGESPDVPASDIKITNSIFQNIYGNAVYGDDLIRGIISMNNTYKNCGSLYEGDQEPVSDWIPIIVFNSNNNYSIADNFHRSLLVSKTYKRIHASNYRIVSFSIDEYMALGSAKNIAGNRQVLIKNQGFSVPLEDKVDTGIINYTMHRGEEYRTGIVKFSRRSAEEIAFDEEYVHTAEIGVTLEIISNPTNSTEIRIAGIADNSIDDDIVFCYDLKTLS